MKEEKNTTNRKKFKISQNITLNNFMLLNGQIVRIK